VSLSSRALVRKRLTDSFHCGSQLIRASPPRKRKRRPHATFFSPVRSLLLHLAPIAWAGTSAGGFRAKASVRMKPSTRGDGKRARRAPQSAAIQPSRIARRLLSRGAATTDPAQCPPDLRGSAHATDQVGRLHGALGIPRNSPTLPIRCWTWHGLPCMILYMKCRCIWISVLPRGRS